MSCQSAPGYHFLRGVQTMALQLLKYYKSHHASASGC
ncbi:unnamed protein product, partial [Staurois parvus]